MQDNLQKPSVNKRPELFVKSSDFKKLDKALSNLEKEAQRKKQATDGVTLANWVTMKYEVLNKLFQSNVKIMSVVEMLKATLGIHVTVATFRTYLKNEKAKREAINMPPVHEELANKNKPLEL